MAEKVPIQTPTPTPTPNAEVICDVCDRPIKNPKKDLCCLYLQGIKEKLNCHANCIRTFMKCKGDFSKLPDGRIKRAILQSQEKDGTILVKNTGITIRGKHVHHIKEGLRISHEEGLQRIEDLAVTFFGLPKPNKEESEYYSIDPKLQIVLMKKEKIKKEKEEESTFNIIEVKRD